MSNSTRRGGAEILDLVGSAVAIPVSAANTGRMRYDVATQKFQSSENGGAFVDVGSGGGGGGGLFGASMSAVPTAASTGFTTWWYQFTGATYTDAEQGPLIVSPTTAGLNRWTARAKVAPATPYTITMLMASQCPLTTNAGGLAYVGWSDAATSSKADMSIVFPNQSVQTYQYLLTDALVVLTGTHNNILRPWGELQWWRLSDNGTTAIVSVSSSGDPASFLPILTKTKAGSHLGASGYNYVLFGILPSQSSGACQILSYEQN